MGEVYEAIDVTLKRHVAIKVLPSSVATDPDRLARFRHEAEILASLNHPHIAQIYGLEQGQVGREGQDDHFDSARGKPIAPFLVLELVEGPTLADIIAGFRLSAPGSGRAQSLGPEAQGLKPHSARAHSLPLDEALNIAGQIADALEAAHERGVIHRDLKPANIKVRGDGAVKVLDFGLAKATEGAHAPGQAASAGEFDASQSPTITTPAMTAAGIILGTAAYMSPEQARGKTVDKRTDIWAFGCVLFEMLTAQRPFSGETVTDVLASVVAREPDWALLAHYPPALQSVVQRCLRKDPKVRRAS